MSAQGTENRPAGTRHFGVCSIGLVLGMTNYWLMSRALAHIGSPPDERP